MVRFRRRGPASPFSSTTTTITCTTLYDYVLYLFVVMASSQCNYLLLGEIYTHFESNPVHLNLVLSRVQRKTLEQDFLFFTPLSFLPPFTPAEDQPSESLTFDLPHHFPSLPLAQTGPNPSACVHPVFFQLFLRCMLERM